MMLIGETATTTANGRTSPVAILIVPTRCPWQPQANRIRHGPCAHVTHRPVQAKLPSAGSSGTLGETSPGLTDFATVAANLADRGLSVTLEGSTVS